MGKGFKRFLKILTLSYPPKNGNSILDWQPFKGGDTLGNIIEKHNIECYESYVRLNWMKDFIEELGEGLEVLLHDLSSLSQLKISDFADIDMILVDVKAIEGEKSKIMNTRTKMTISRKSYHLPQVCNTIKVRSCLSDFKPLPVIPSRPEIIRNQESFENYLKLFCHFYQKAITSVPPPASGGGGKTQRVYDRYKNSIPKIASEVRDAAIRNNLSLNQVPILATRASTFELTLSKISEEIKTKTRPNIIFDHLRETIEEIPVKPIKILPHFEEVNLLGLSIKTPLHELSSAMREKLEVFGLKQKNTVAVHLHESKLLKDITKLEKFINITEFSADLPSWDK